MQRPRPENGPRGCPPKVEYSLTGLGASLLEAMGPLREWSEENFERVEAARSRFREWDAAAPGYSVS